MAADETTVRLPKVLVYGLILAIFTELIVIGGYMVQWNIEYQIHRAATDRRLDHIEARL